MVAKKEEKCSWKFYESHEISNLQIVRAEQDQEVCK